MPSLEFRLFHRPVLSRLVGLTGLVLACGATAVLAHEPVARCVLLDAETVRCRGATNDGDELPGERIEVIAVAGGTLFEGRLDSRSIVSFARPAEPYYVLLDIGPGLQVSIEQDEIAAPPAGRVPRWMQRP